MLSVGTLCLNIGALPFMTLVSQDGSLYAEVPSDDRLPEVESHAAPAKPRRARTVSIYKAYKEAGKPYTEPAPKTRTAPDAEEAADGALPPPAAFNRAPSPSDTSSLSRTWSDDEEDDPYAPRDTDTPATPLSRRSTGRSPDVEVTGFRVLGSLEFWQLFAILALLAGVGLMTIKSVSPVLTLYASADTAQQHRQRRQSPDPPLERARHERRHAEAGAAARLDPLPGQLRRAPPLRSVSPPPNSHPN